MEAQGRIGGRIREEYLTPNLINHAPTTGTGTESPVLTVQLGANWIHGLHAANPFHCAALSLGLGLFETSSDNAPGDDVCLFDAGPSRASNISVSGGSCDGNRTERSCDSGDGHVFAPVSSALYSKAMRRFKWMCDNLGAVMGCEKEGSGEGLVLYDALQHCLTASEEDDTDPQ